MSLKFPYQFERVDNVIVPYPVVIVSLKTIFGPRSYSFIMDTGADTSTMPNYMIGVLGLDKKVLRWSKSQGIGRELIKVREGEIKITLDDTAFSLMCSFTGNNKTPFLLGKQGVFDRYNILFDNDSKTTIFSEKKKRI